MPKRFLSPFVKQCWPIHCFYFISSRFVSFSLFFLSCYMYIRVVVAIIILMVYMYIVHYIREGSKMKRALWDLYFILYFFVTLQSFLFFSFSLFSVSFFSEKFQRCKCEGGVQVNYHVFSTIVPFNKT